MKTELIHSYSSSSLAKLSPSPNIIRRNNKDDAGSVSTIPSIDHNNDYPHHDEFEEQGWCSESLHRAFRKKNILKKFPILSWLPKYNTSKAISDTIAGITVGMTLIPQGLAMAAVAGLPMQVNLSYVYTYQPSRYFIHIYTFFFLDCSMDFTLDLLGASFTLFLEVHKQLR